MKMLNTEILSRAFNGTSFVPEKRAIQAQEDYRLSCEKRLEELLNAAKIEEAKEVAIAEAEKINAIAANLLNDYYQRRSNCTSAMITGSSGYNNRRAEKANRSADRVLDRYNELMPKLMKRAFKRINPNSGAIMAGDDNAVERLKAEIAVLEDRQERMKAVNKILRSKKLSDEEKRKQVFELLPKLSEPAFLEMSNPRYSYYKSGFQGFELTNNGANMRRLKDRLVAIERAKATEDQVLDKPWGRVEVCHADNRVRVFHDETPEADIRKYLKSNGFRWTPSLTCWQAYINDRSLNIAKGL